jgi:hypothetical protein
MDAEMEWAFGLTREDLERMMTEGQPVDLERRCPKCEGTGFDTVTGRPCYDGAST